MASSEDSEIIIATRGSELALWQAHFLQQKLKDLGYESKLNIIKTKGDQIQNLSFDKIEGKGFFTKEIEDALLSGEARVAVHSMKDLPTENPEGLVLGAVSYREDPRDCLISLPAARDESKILMLKDRAVIGTSSNRRKSQILDLRPDFQVEDLRGNVPTRIQKLRDGKYDAILLAAAGISRLNLDLTDLDVRYLHPREFVPAPAQGVLAFQCKAEDTEIRKILAKLHHTDVSACTNVERRVLKMMGGGCHLPLGVFVEKDPANNYRAYAAISDSTGASLKRISIAQTTTDALAENIFQQLTKSE